MKKYALTGSVFILLMLILILFYTKSRTNLPRLSTFDFTVNKELDKPADLTDTVNTENHQYNFCDVIVKKRSLLPFEESLNILTNKLHYCQNEIDSLETISVWFYRIFPVEAYGDDNVPEINNWKKLPFADKYRYAKNEVSGVFCVQRCIAMQQFLDEYFGYKDIIRISYSDTHTFLLVRSRQSDDAAFIIDGQSPHGYYTSKGKLDWISYLHEAKNNPDSLMVYDVPQRFGKAQILFDKNDLPFISWILNNDCDSLNYFFDQPLEKGFLGEGWKWGNRNSWIPEFIFISENTTAFPFKLVRMNQYVNVDKWRKFSGYDEKTIWVNPKLKISCTVNGGCDKNWVKAIVNLTAEIIYLDEPISVYYD